MVVAASVVSQQQQQQLEENPQNDLQEGEDDDDDGNIIIKIASLSNDDDDDEDKVSKKPNPRRRKQQEKKLDRIAFKRDLVESFTSQLLDESFQNLPVRASTVEAAKLYDNNQNSKKTLMPGTHKHLGGAYDPTDGCIYGVPANSRAVLCLYPVAMDKHQKKDGDEASQYEYKMTTIPLPDDIADGRFKWLRGIFAHGCMWAIPSWAPAVLCVDVDAFWGRRPPQKRKGSRDSFVELIPLPPDYPHRSGGMEWQWHGAGINADKTAIFCIPSNAETVLKVDLIQRTTSLLPITYDKNKYPSFSAAMTNKWYGGIVGHDNCVYGIPYRACAVLRIDCTAETATLIGPDYGCGHYYWHGGIQVGGKIYAHPSHADTVLVVNTDPNLSSSTSRTYELPITRASYDTDARQNYKWLGGSLGRDGNIYCPACDTSSVLKIDTTTDTCTTFGFAGTLKNKWQGGVLARDGCIYCIPASGTQVLRIYTGTDLKKDEENPIQLLGDLPVHKDKWQGGHVGKDGCLYFIPENGYRVLKVIPPLHPPQLINGKLPEKDVTLELL